MERNTEERIARLEARARQAEDTIRQLNAYLVILRKQQSSSCGSTLDAENEVKQLQIENSNLMSEVTGLKKKLVELETMSGVAQVPVPSMQSSVKNSSASCTIVSSSQTKSEPQPNSKPESNSKSKPESNSKSKPGSNSQSKPSNKKKQEPAEKKGKAVADAALPVDVSRLDFRIGRILKVQKHPDADTLYVEEVETGEPSNRTVVSGLVKHVPMDQMIDRMVVLLCNLKPAKMRGVVSEAMVMCASTPDLIEILDPPPGCVPGERLTFQGYKGEPDAQLNPKKKIFEQVQPDLRTNEEGVACYKGVPFTVEGKGVCRAASMTCSPIK